MKEQMRKEIQKEVSKVLNHKEAILNIVDEMEKLAELGEDAVMDLENRLVNKQESIADVSDMKEAKQLKAEIDNLKEEMDLQKTVNKSKSSAKLREVEEKAVSFFDVQKETVSQFNEMDIYYLNNSSLSNMKEDIALLESIALDLNNSFKAVRYILLDTGIVSVADQNRRYKGHHLGKREVFPELVTFHNEIRPVIQKFKQSGKVVATL